MRRCDGGCCRARRKGGGGWGLEAERGLDVRALTSGGKGGS